MRFLLSIILFVLPSFATLKTAPTNITGKNILTNENYTWSFTDKKQVLVVVFLSAKCPCSDSHNTELIDLARTYPQFQFIAIHSNPDESLEHSQFYFSKAQLNFPVLQDDNLKWANTLHAKKTPHAFVINSEGIVLYQGGVSSSNKFQNADKKFLRTALMEISENKPVSTPEGRTLGCSISRDQDD